jgi:hypothetical protein
MFDESYPVRYSNRIKPYGAQYTLHILTFRCRFNWQYIIHVEQYDHYVFGVKFHLKAHKDSDRKYNLLSGLNDPFRVLSTVVRSMKYFSEKFPLASFAFFGAELEGESVDNTKRFRVYRPVMENFFLYDDFEHRLLLQESFYLMLNIQHRDQNPDLFPYIVTTFRALIGKPEE